MNKTIDLSNTEIIAKVAERKRLLKENADDQRAERKVQLDKFVMDYLVANAMMPEDFDFVLELLEPSFVYQPSDGLLAIIAIREQQAYETLGRNIQTEMWGLDTCGCRLFALYDSVIGYGDTIQTYFANTCPEHGGLGFDERHDVVHAENKRKNNILRALCGHEGLTLGTDDGAGQLKSGIEYVWSFSGDGATRVLTVQLTGITLSAQKKTALQNFCDTKFGVGKVVIL